MGREAKKQVYFRLSETTIKELEQIAKAQKVSQADVITVLLHIYHANSVPDLQDVADEVFDIVRKS